MKFSYLISILIIIVVAWGSLFITVINQSSKIKAVIAYDQTLSLQNDKIDKQLQSNITRASTARNAQLTTILKDMQCIATFFAQPDRTNLTLTNLQACTLQPISSSGGATGSTKSD